jgi:hypothetical protein
MISNDNDERVVVETDLPPSPHDIPQPRVDVGSLEQVSLMGVGGDPVV